MKATWGTSSKPVQLLILMLAMIAISPVLVQAQAPPIQFDTDLPGVGLVGQQFMIALPIINDSTLTATNVQVTGVTLPPASLISPATLPATLGTFVPEQRTIFQADFDATGLAHNTLYVLTVTGTCQVNEVTFDFTVTRSVGLPPATPGSAATKAGKAPAESLSGAPFSPGPFGPEPNENEPSPPVPTGPVVAGTPTPQSTSVQPFQAPGSAAPAGEVIPSAAVTINTNQAFGNLRSAGPAGDPG
ncbi:MAG: hypothetical protein ACREAC_12430, partial [Blastocatellia bacterium]